MTVTFPKSDWYQVMTIAEAEKEFEGFKFQDVGWYVCKGDYMYVCKGDYMLVIVDPSNPAKHRFHVYNGRNPIEEFKKISELPVYE